MVPVGVLALLADGRFPVGGHAHSAGLEAAASAFPLDDAEELARFVAGRLSTVGLTEANLVAVIATQLASGTLDWDRADQEIEARIASPALRSTSRLLGRQWARAGAEVIGGPHNDRARRVDRRGPHQVMAYAAVAIDAGLRVDDAVALHLHHLVSTITTAAVRLHGIDPYEAARLQRNAVVQCDSIVETAVAGAKVPWDRVPAPASPIADILAEHHAVADMRLFRS